MRDCRFVRNDALAPCISYPSLIVFSTVVRGGTHLPLLSRRTSVVSRNEPIPDTLRLRPKPATAIFCPSLNRSKQLSMYISTAVAVIPVVCNDLLLLRIFKMIRG